MSEQYTIKQVLFIVSDEKHQIIPIQIVERNVKQTLEGEEITYKVKDPKGENVYDLHRIKGKIFTNPQQIREVLKKNIIESIDKMVDMSIKIAKNKFSFQDVKNPQNLFQAQPNNTLEKYDELEIETSDEMRRPVVQPLPTKQSLIPEEDAPTIEILDPVSGKPQKAKIKKISMGGEG